MHLTIIKLLLLSVTLVDPLLITSLSLFQSKIIRVLNLWQKNQVFAPEVIQPLFDLADPNHPIHKDPAIAAIAAAAAAAAAATATTSTSTSNGLASTPTKGKPRKGLKKLLKSFGFQIIIAVSFSVVSKPGKPESVTPLWLAQAASMEATKSTSVSPLPTSPSILSSGTETEMLTIFFVQTPAPANNTEPNLLQQLQQLQSLILNKQQQDASKSDQV